MKLHSSSFYHLKPINFPNEFFTIAVDTREKEPLFRGFSVSVVSKALENGDYSILGFEDKIAVERKCISDLITYVSKDHKKTKVKLERMSKLEWKALVIEATEADILSPQFYSGVSVEVIRQTLASWEVKYGINVYYNRDRKQIERWILDRFLKFYAMKRSG